MSEINTGGGASIGGNANAGGDIVGRDQIFVTVINQFADAAKSREEGRDQAEHLVIKWQNADPVAAEERYRQSLINHYNRLRIFGTSSEVPLQNVFTDVYIFNEPHSRIHYDFESLRSEMAEEMRPGLRHRSDQRTNGMALVKKEDNLFILGKPGAGKTTFLKYLTLQAAQRSLNRLPIFVSLNEWVNSPHGKGADPQLLPFIVHQFEICHFDDAEPFVEALLRSGRAMLLFDGLDEVRQEDEQRRKLTQLLKDFARQYDRSQHLITCRIAASEYAFPGFRDVEVADFTDEQVKRYAELWFQTVGKSHEHFVEQLTKAENAGVRELCSSPLLLSMVCLYFEQLMRFPPNRAELYEKAIEALLNKWDASRDILRDEILRGEILYRELSPRRKEQMFAAIAARTFESGDYFFRRRDLGKWIGDYLRTLPNVKPDDEIDNNAVLRAIEAQHGIFVEWARDIYSFSHLTFQEYFTARYIFDNERRGATTRLLRDHLDDNRWREVFLLTVSLFDREGADDFFSDMRRVIDCLVSDPALCQLLIWADTRTVAANPPDEQEISIRLSYILLGSFLNPYFDFDFDFELESNLYPNLDIAHTLVPSLSLPIQFVQKLALERARDRICDLDIIIDSDLARDIVNEQQFDLAYNYEMIFALSRCISEQVGFDYGLYYAWIYAERFAQEWWLRDNDEVSDSIAPYLQFIPKLTQLAIQANRDNLVVDLSLPTNTANIVDWQQFTDTLHAIMQESDLVHDWQFTDDQIDKLNNYFYANELLVQCLNVAVVSDRQAILAGLLAPPAVGG